MKTYITITLLLFAISTLAGVAPAASAEKCGDLGLMTFADGSLEKDVDPAQIRACKEHPLPNPRPEGAIGPHPVSDTQEVADNLTVANYWGWRGGKHPGWGYCWKADPGEYGCSRGYCYKACDDSGRWCWTARNRGYGSWKTCDSRADCRVDATDGGCGRGCKACGCSC
ncbi:hypothetical protein CPLU01_10042 [Colletotrichum plurivorum]|uniref:IDI-2 n=1 Tax=Colletotrichum plurivorum TaxID=2175906 RepID=A0A8H6NAU9_9PEZI|nr:hypothetical protein CPLU01_10042 [Colletotrichum plurivorum]